MDYKIPDNTPESQEAFLYAMSCLDAVSRIEPDVVNFVMQQLQDTLPETEQKDKHPVISYMHKSEDIRRYTRQSIVVLQMLLLLVEHIQKRKKIGSEIGDEALRLMSMYNLMRRKDEGN